MKNSVIGFSISLCLLVLFFGSNHLASTQNDLLANPSFEDSYTGGVAEDWSAWHYDSMAKKDCSAEVYYTQPVWSAELASRSLILDGVRSQHVGNQWDTWRGGVSQSVDGVTVGETYRFKASMIGRVSNNQWPAASDPDGFINGRVGIDPSGGSDFAAASVAWGDAIIPRDSWQTATVQTVATSTSITVFVEADFGAIDNCYPHLDMWFDSASLVAGERPILNRQIYLPVLNK